jgi:carbonic anhydrase
MDRILRGFLEYREKKLPELAPLFRKLARGQNPSALFFACSDSRFDPNLVVSADPGEIFVHRSVGNLIPPAGGDGISKGDLSEASAIEYAVEVLGIRDVVVFGHSSCGAIGALIQGVNDPTVTPNLAVWLKLAEGAKERTKDLIFDPALSEADQVSQANVVVQMEHAATYPAIRKKLQTRSVGIHGAWFEVATGEVSYFIPDERRFVLVNDRAALEYLERVSKLNAPVIAKKRP